jgi:hypothetical protein
LQPLLKLEFLVITLEAAVEVVVLTALAELAVVEQEAELLELLTPAVVVAETAMQQAVTAAQA